MALVTKAIKGTQDIMPDEVYKNQFIEQTMLDIARKFGFREIRTPVFEHTELFQRGVGETTDVVQKEMYTFDDKGGRSITLRPEGTAGAVRAFLEHGLFNEALPQKFCYLINCYRYEKPQAGRWREFQQFGVEMIGAGAPAADAEVISLANEIFAFLGVEGLELQINSIGCPECRKNYHNALKEYFESKKEELCGTCLGRLEKNPMRILDCKSPVCSEIAKDAPAILDYICDDCSAHFESVKKYLDKMNIAYSVNPRIVRGLDYYTRTVFEFVSTQIGAQGTVCGGGRYDGLVEELGGAHVPSLGFGMGTGRLLMLLEAQGIELPKPSGCDLYIAPMGENASYEAAAIVADLRAGGMGAQTDVVGRSLKAQMKYADKIGAKFTMVLGDDEIAQGKAKIKNMESGESTEMELERIADDFMEFLIRQETAALGESLSLVENIDLSGILGQI
ncbi:MAG: histidine--tRNA ligase [Clostridia bacterium]|nr:histidine--tRNA ligase [Clostridia bacterium]MBQ3007398.1 histidine--tRNA ligase [Clostridia bacterium]